MAPSATLPTNASSSKPKRKRQRKRKEVASSSSSSSSSSDDSEDEDEATKVQPVALPQASSSSSEASSSSEDEGSEDERTKRRGRIPNGKTGINSNNGTSSIPSTVNRRPYPSRSPSPQIADPANLPLGQSPFPLLKSLDDGAILPGFIVGDVGVEGEANEADRNAEDKVNESKFGEWWRARLVSEFETDLGGLAVEPGLTAPRLSLLLDSLTALSTLHTTSSSSATLAKSIWVHDPLSAVDPLSELGLGDGGDEWGKAVVGGLSDLEVGEEGVTIDLSKRQNEVSKMEVD